MDTDARFGIQRGGSEARRLLMLGSSACAGRSPTAASAIAVTIRIPATEPFHRRKNMRYSLPTGLRLATSTRLMEQHPCPAARARRVAHLRAPDAQFHLPAPYRRPPIYAGLHRISGWKDGSYYRDFIAIERLLKPPRWQPKNASLAPNGSARIAGWQKTRAASRLLEFSSR